MQNMISRKLFVPKLNKIPELYHGKNSVSVVKYIGQSPILVIASGTVRGIKAYAQIMHYLEGKSLFEEIIADCSNKEIEEIAAKQRGNGVRAILAVGGGKVMDAAKIIRCFLQDSGLDFEKIRDCGESNEIKLACIPTTPGTGSHASPIAVIKNDNDVKIPYVNSCLTPDLAILDPMLIEGIDGPLMAEFMADIFAHAAESSVSKLSNAYIKQIAKSSMELLLEAANEMTSSRDAKALEKLMFAGHIAGMAQSNAFVGCCHALAHALEGKLRLRHGQALLSVIKPCLEWHGHKLKLKEYDYYLDVYHKLGIDEYADKKLIDNIDDASWAKLALEDPSIKTNPLIMRMENLIELVKWMKQKA